MSNVHKARKYFVFVELLLWNTMVALVNPKFVIYDFVFIHILITNYLITILFYFLNLNVIISNIVLFLRITVISCNQIKIIFSLSFFLTLYIIWYLMFQFFIELHYFKINTVTYFSIGGLVKTLFCCIDSFNKLVYISLLLWLGCCILKYKVLF